MEDIILIIHTLAAAAVIGLVMMQHGKGAEAGAAFGGGGASGSLFGVSGSSNLLSRLTAIFIAVFFCTSLVLGYLASHSETGSVVKTQAPAVEVEVPAIAVEPSTDDIPQ